jgi:hypothetical protein
MIEEKRGPGRPPKMNSTGNKEIDKAVEQFDAFDNNLKQMTLDRMNTAPKEEIEPQTQLSQNALSKKKDIYLKPDRSISSKEKFNEKFRTEYEFQKQFVQFIAENKEIIGETIELWTKPFPGMPAEFWKVPCNKPLWGPRYLAERIANCKYHRFVMQQHVSTGADGMGQYYGGMAVDTTVPRLDALPVNERKSIFMGASSF